jgi:hypothetical protein
MKTAFNTIIFLSQATLLLLNFTCVALLYALFSTEQATLPVLSADTIDNATFIRMNVVKRIGFQY